VVCIMNYNTSDFNGRCQARTIGTFHAKLIKNTKASMEQLPQYVASEIENYLLSLDVEV